LEIDPIVSSLLEESHLGCYEEGIFEALHPTISSKDINSQVIKHTPLFPVILGGSSWMLTEQKTTGFQYFQ